MVTQLEAGAIGHRSIAESRRLHRLKERSKVSGVIGSADRRALRGRLQSDDAALDNKKLRQALSYAVDKKARSRYDPGRLGARILAVAGRQPPTNRPAELMRSTSTKPGRCCRVGCHQPRVRLYGHPVNDQTTGFAQIYQGDLAKIGSN